MQFYKWSHILFHRGVRIVILTIARLFSSRWCRRGVQFSTAGFDYNDNRDNKSRGFTKGVERRERESGGDAKGAGRVQTVEGAICGSRSALTNVSIPWQRVSVHGNPRWAVKIRDWGRFSGAAHDVNSSPRVLRFRSRRRAKRAGKARAAIIASPSWEMGKLCPRL